MFAVTKESDENIHRKFPFVSANLHRILHTANPALGGDELPVKSVAVLGNVLAYTLSLEGMSGLAYSLFSGCEAPDCTGSTAA